MAKTRGVYEKPADSGIWWINYYHQGKRHRERVGRKSDAIALYQTRKTEARRGIKLPELSRKRVTLGEVIDRGIAYAKDHNRDVRSFISRGEILRKAFGSRDAATITADELTEWLKRRGVSNSTFNRYKALLSRCYRESAKLVPVNVAKEMRKRREPAGRHRYLAPAEYQDLLKAITIRNKDKLPRFIVSVFSGMRRGEQFTLEWPQIDFDRDEINLAFTKNGDDRSIPLHPEARAVLLELRGKTIRKRGLVFPRDGENLDQMGWFAACLEDAGITEYTWHSNRHTFCSWLALAGVPLLTIKELAGHKSIATTVRYAHLSPDHRKTELRKLSAPKPNVLKFKAS